MNDVDVGSGILDSVKKGMKLSEAGYGVVENPVSISISPMTKASMSLTFCNSRSQRSSQLWD